jgi:hypothetical protein
MQKNYTSTPLPQNVRDGKNKRISDSGSMSYKKPKKKKARK